VWPSGALGGFLAMVLLRLIGLFTQPLLFSIAGRPADGSSPADHNAWAGGRVLVPVAGRV